MNIFNRFFATAPAPAEKTSAQTENYYALVETALQDTHAAAGRARIRLARVMRDGENLQRKLIELRYRERLWAERARDVAEEDEYKALECVQRRNLCREQVIQVNEALRRHAELEHNINNSVTQVEQRLKELTQQRNLLSSDNPAVDVKHIIGKLESNSQMGLHEIIDDRDTLVAEKEYAVGNVIPIDSLHEAFMRLENADTLRIELDAIINGDAANDSSSNKDIN